jgi:hypothetical protein
MLKVHRLALLLFSGLLCYGCQPHPAGPEQAGTPNILFVMFDDMGKEWVSAYGSESVSTPAIDALASDGMRTRFAMAGSITGIRLAGGMVTSTGVNTRAWQAR